MYRMISCTVVTALAVITVLPAAADDRSVCANGTGDDAIAACSRWLMLHPRDFNAYNKRGVVYSIKGEYDRAISEYGLAIGLDPKNAVLYFNRGSVYYYKGEYDRAIADFNQAISLDPKHADAYNSRGLSYKEKGDEDRAMADFSLAITADPNRAAAAYNSRGNIYNRRGEYDRAIADFSLAISLAPKVAAIYKNRGNTYNHKGEYDHAIVDLSMAISLDPKPALPYSFRGFSYARKGDFERAMGDVNRAVALEPANAEGYSSRAAVYALRGDADRAIADADEALRLDPKGGSAYVWRAKAWLDKGQYDRATADYDQALKRDPASATEAQEGRERAVAALAARQAPAGPAVQIASQPEAAAPGIKVVPDAKPPAAAPGLPARRALVIGIDAYPNLAAAAQLERAVADAEAVGDRLASLGFQVTRLASPGQNTLDELLSGFEAFRKTVARNDVVALFYAGHGMGLSDGTYLVPSDVKEASLEVEATARRAAINETEFTDSLQRAGASIVVAVIDACRNDLFSRGTRRTMSNERGLRPVETEGIFKLYSASEGQTALDRLPGGDASRNSVFTRVFLKAISMPGLNLSALGTTVRDEVYRLARSADHAQIPAVYDKLIGSTQVYFAGEAAAERRAQ
jgi:tetratricopeptide (TPR) repeat protein